MLIRHITALRPLTCTMNSISIYLHTWLDLQISVLTMICSHSLGNLTLNSTLSLTLQQSEMKAGLQLAWLTKGYKMLIRQKKDMFSYVCWEWLNHSSGYFSRLVKETSDKASLLFPTEHQVATRRLYTREMSVALTLFSAPTSSFPHWVHEQRPSTWPLTLEH